MEQFQGKGIVVVGLSTEGQDAFRFFLSHNLNVIGADRRDEQTFFQAYPALLQYKSQLSLGTTYLSRLKDADIIVRTPGMALSTPELQEAEKAGKTITSNTKIFFSLCKAPIIGVTGTKGKGTTSTLIYEMLKKSGKHAYLGGNVGTPLLGVVDKILPSDWVVLELSSFQLEDLEMSPHIAVVLMVTQEHLANFDPLATNFHISREAYVAAKKNIVSHQKETDTAVVYADNESSLSFASSTPAKILTYGTGSGVNARIDKGNVSLLIENTPYGIAGLRSMKLRGSHNLENIAAASLAAYAAHVSIQDIQTVAQNFQGLPFRLETAGVKQGVTYINDSFSTTPETTIAAIHAFTDPIIVILGGSEKGSDFTEMGKAIAKSTVKKVIVIGQMTERIIASLQKGGFQGEILSGLTTMHDMVVTASHMAKSGYVVLLSPACASFGLFKNYKERGIQFMYEVSRL